MSVSPVTEYPNGKVKSISPCLRFPQFYSTITLSWNCLPFVLSMECLILQPSLHMNCSENFTMDKIIKTMSKSLYHEWFEQVFFLNHIWKEAHLSFISAMLLNSLIIAIQMHYTNISTKYIKIHTAAVKQTLSLGYRWPLTRCDFSCNK